MHAQAPAWTGPTFCANAVQTGPHPHPTRRNSANSSGPYTVNHSCAATSARDTSNKPIAPIRHERLNSEEVAESTALTASTISMRIMAAPCPNPIVRVASENSVCAKRLLGSLDPILERGQ